MACDARVYGLSFWLESGWKVAEKWLGTHEQGMHR
jgi:hypothetical protein